MQEAAGDNDESEDIAKGLARVFAEVGEAYVSLISAGECPPTRCPPSHNSEQYTSSSARLLSLACCWHAWLMAGRASRQASVFRYHAIRESSNGYTSVMLYIDRALS